MHSKVMASENTVSDEIYFLMQMENFLKTNYVEEIKDLDLLRGAIKGMIESLDDPYSVYFTPSEFKDFTETTSGNFGGIGVVITLRDKFVTAVSVLEGSPAEKAGIKPGDRFVEIDGDDVTDLTTAEISKRLRGDKATTVNVGVLRDGDKQIIRLDIERDTIRVNPIDAKVLGQGVGYIKISEFNENTAGNLRRR